MSAAADDIDKAMEALLSGPQRRAVRRLTACGYDRRSAVRRLINLGIRCYDGDLHDAYEAVRCGLNYTYTPLH
jgi:hypothetical protein